MSQYACWVCHHQHPTGEVCGYDDAPDNPAVRVCMCER